MVFTKFYKKTREERIEILKKLNIISDEDFNILIKDYPLDLEIAGKMAENNIGTFGLPLGVVPNILVDNKKYVVPMVTEEPSVIAACSNASKIIEKTGGFKTTIHSREMIGEVALYDVENMDFAIKNIEKNIEKIIEIANSAHPSIVKRGGGARDIFYKIVQDDEVEFLIVYLTVDVKEAMGANILNNMLEAIKPTLENITKSTALMAILSNYAIKSLTTSECIIPINILDNNIEIAKNIAKKIHLASKLSKLDIYRATTHNKGIFNGIDAVVIATGNDWRAIEASCNAYAVKNGKYQGLSNWIFDEKNNILKGELTIPMPIATVGGSIGINEKVKIAHKILNNPNAKTLASIIVSIGLAQNFAAIKALVTEGINKGHMKLQSKSLAILVGAKNEEIDILAEQLQNEKHINIEAAKEILNKLRNQAK